MDRGQGGGPCRGKEVETQVVVVGDDLRRGVRVVGGGFRDGVLVGGERPG